MPIPSRFFSREILSVSLACVWMMFFGGNCGATQTQEVEKPDAKISIELRTEKFLYIRNFSPEVQIEKAKNSDKEIPVPETPREELYDLSKDVKSESRRVNLVDDPKFVEDRKRLAKQLVEQQRSSGHEIFQLPGHATFLVRGWKVHLSDELWIERPRKTKTLLNYLDVQLGRAIDLVPEKTLPQIRRVPIWINLPPDGERPTAVYHPNAQWLRDHDRNPSMARCVELTNVMNFKFEDTRMPLMLLHEMAHAFHDQVLDFRNVRIRTAYEAAKESGGYEKVKRFTGRAIVMDKAYGMNNAKEYFAESSEAYFGANDFYPFNREELLSHDPKMHDLVKELWGDK